VPPCSCPGAPPEELLSRVASATMQLSRCAPGGAAQPRGECHHAAVQVRPRRSCSAAWRVPPCSCPGAPPEELLSRVASATMQLSRCAPGGAAQPRGECHHAAWTVGEMMQQGCWEAFCGTASASAGFGMGLFRAKSPGFSPAKAVFTAVLGRQHNCLPFALEVMQGPA
jgi:hypothetical protein